jgi:hypothetical protein
LKEETEQKNLFDIDLADINLKIFVVEEKEMNTNFDISTQVRRLISEAVKQCSHSRAVIAARLSDLLGVHITEHMLNAWSAESKDGYRFPLEYAPAFCYVTGETRLLKIGPIIMGLKVLEDKDIMWLEYHKVREIEKKARAQRKNLEKRLKGEGNG